MFNFPNMYSGNIVTVYGRQGAEAFQMMPNSSIVLIDSTADRVWLAQTDGAGFKTLRPFIITPEQDKPTSTLEERVARLEGLFNESNVAGNEPNGASSTDDESGAVSE